MEQERGEEREEDTFDEGIEDLRDEIEKVRSSVETIESFVESIRYSEKATSRAFRPLRRPRSVVESIRRISMNSLEEKHITTETVFIGLKAYSFEITGDCITRYGLHN